jgi:hypothetical protein
VGGTALQGTILQQRGLPMNDYLHSFDKFPSSVPKHVLTPEVKRLDNALNALPVLLERPEYDLEKISELTDLSLTELRFGNWERLYNYIRTLEKQLLSAQNKLATQDEKMRELVIFVEKTSQNIVKLYREFSIRNSDE